MVGETETKGEPAGEHDSKSLDKKESDVDCVCVTGAGGFIASWLVKCLLAKGYVVRGTVQNPEDTKNAHLRELDGAAERLTLVKADLMDFESLASAMKGCYAVFHLASPITDDPVQMVEPAVQGTLNVLAAASQAGIRRVLLTSSIGAVAMDPHRDPSTVVDESCWSDLEYCKDTKNWYCYAKVVAEKAAWDYAKAKDMDLVVLIPSLVMGPLLQSTVNASTQHILKYLTGWVNTYANSVQAYVDVRDVAEACILLNESSGANGRYLCAESVVHRGDVCDILAELFPQYPIPRKCSDEKGPRVHPYQFSNEKLRSLGHVFIPLKKSLLDTVQSLQHHNIVHLEC